MVLSVTFKNPATSLMVRISPVSTVARIDPSPDPFGEGAT